MEGFFILLLLGGAVALIVMPFITWMRTSETRRDIGKLNERVDHLSWEIQGLRRRLEATADPARPLPAQDPTESKLDETFEKLWQEETQAAAEKQTTPSPSPEPHPSLEPLETGREATQSQRWVPDHRATAQETPAVKTLSEADASAKAEAPSLPPPMPPALKPVPPQFPWPAKPQKTPIQWEKFVGAKLIMWLGGLLLFLTAAYFVKYSIEKELISPEMRVTLGFFAGISLVIGGFTFKRKAYAVASQTFCATGVVILYAVTFACRSAYHFSAFTPGLTFALMVLITASAFLLAVRMNALVVAVLGMLGGFLTPLLLSTGVDNPPGLFLYIALLDIGLVAVALARPWGYLVPMAAVGTGLMQIGWALKFLNSEKLQVVVWTHLGFNALFSLAAEIARRRKVLIGYWTGAAAGLAILAQVTALVLAGDAVIGTHIGHLGAVSLGADLCLLGLALSVRGMGWGQPVGGLLIHLFLAVWMAQHLTDARLYWALGAVLIVALIHGGFPILLSRVQPGSKIPDWTHAFPPLALLLLLMPVFKLATAPVLVWPVIFLIHVVAVAFTVVTRSLLSLLGVLFITGFVAIAWILTLPANPAGAETLLLIIGAMSVVFVFAVLFALRKLGGFAQSTAEGTPGSSRVSDLSDEAIRTQLPALTALMPFLLLILVVVRMPLPNPSPVFALAMALTVLLLSVSRTFSQQGLTLVALGSVTVLEMIWHWKSFHMDVSPLISLGWPLAFSTLILSYPFANRTRCMASSKPWAAAALALPAHFYLIYRAIEVAWPNSMMGLVPALLSLAMLACTFQAARWFTTEQPKRNAALAWLGGSALFFITLIFPIQFERQWITVSWALEGAALCWMFRRLPHPGVRWTGLGLLAITLVRLTLNPAVLEYHPRSSTAIFNWYLYTYGSAIASFFLASHWLAAPRDRIGKLSCQPFLRASAALLLFLLLNIEIADYFTSVGDRSLVFQFSGNFARDMSYTIAWGVFALGLVTVGIVWKSQGSRYSGLALLGITLLKLFFHDLGQLPQLYRIGALAGVAIAAILASILYQKFVASEESSEKSPPPS